MIVFVAVKVVVMTVIKGRNRNRNWHVMMMMRYLKKQREWKNKILLRKYLVQIYIQEREKSAEKKNLCAYLVMVVVILGVAGIVAGAELEDVRERRDEEEH